MSENEGKDYYNHFDGGMITYDLRVKLVEDLIKQKQLPPDFLLHLYEYIKSKNPEVIDHSNELIDNMIIDLVYRIDIGELIWKKNQKKKPKSKVIKPSGQWVLIAFGVFVLFGSNYVGGSVAVSENIIINSIIGYIIWIIFGFIIYMGVYSIIFKGEWQDK